MSICCEKKPFFVQAFFFFKGGRCYGSYDQARVRRECYLFDNHLLLDSKKIT